MKQIKRFRNSRVAKYFADTFDGEYLGWIDDSTNYTIKRGSKPVSSIDTGCFAVILEEEYNDNDNK